MLTPPLSSDPAGSTISGTAVAVLSPAITVSWLNALLVHCGPTRDVILQSHHVRRQLSGIPLATILTAIEETRATAPRGAEVALLRSWIETRPRIDPDCYIAWFNLGVALAQEKDYAGAALAYDKARALNPSFNAAAINLGLTLETMGHAGAALRTWNAALQPDDSRVLLLNHRGRLLENLGQLEEADAALTASLLTQPDQPDAIQHWLHLRQRMCRWPVLDTALRGLSPSELLRHSGPLAMLALTDDIALQREVGVAWINRKIPPAPLRLAPPAGYHHARLRVGYISSDFCRHAMSFLIAELFERHDRSRIEVFGYCSTLEDGSDIRKRVLAAFDHVRLIADHTDEQAARLIRSDEIDVLIDLNGLTARTRLPVLRWRPAPVQMTYLGFVGPVPLPELDYMLCDDIVVPPRSADLYWPKPLAIGPVYQANDSRRAIAEPLSRAEAGLPEGPFVFCCFSNHYKITAEMFVAWTAILQVVENSVLWLASDNAWSESNLRGALRRAGVDPERLLFADRTSPDTYMRRLACADLFLDTFPYNAGTVASDALRMGLPLITVAGRSFASRMAASLLTAIGAQTGIAADLATYQRLAVQLATDPDAYASFRRLFTSEIWAARLGDMERFTRSFEEALLNAVPRVGVTA